MTEDYADIADVQNRLDEEAARMDAAHGGLHRFNNIRPYSGPGGANWTANYGARGGTVGLHDAVMLTEMRDVLRRIQTEIPLIRFQK